MQYPVYVTLYQYHDNIADIMLVGTSDPHAGERERVLLWGQKC